MKRPNLPPGPYQMDNRGLSYSNRICTSSDYQFIVTIPRVDGEPEINKQRDALAQVVVALPDVLEALEMTLKYFRDEGPLTAEGTAQIIEDAMKKAGYTEE